MKHNSIILVLTLIIYGSVLKAQDRIDPVKKARSANEKKADKDLVNGDVAEFLVKSADARMMDSREGKLAIKNGTTSSIRDYGSLMVKDQAMLLEKIKKLAVSRNISLPSDISNDKNEGHEDLQEKQGEGFDKKFIKMMVIDHERDVKMFKKAIECEDREISTFAKKYLPLIQSHLDKINAIKG